MCFYIIYCLFHYLHYILLVSFSLLYLKWYSHCICIFKTLIPSCLQVTTLLPSSSCSSLYQLVLHIHTMNPTLFSPNRRRPSHVILFFYFPDLIFYPEVWKNREKGRKEISTAAAIRFFFLISFLFIHMIMIIIIIPISCIGLCVQWDFQMANHLPEWLFMKLEKKVCKASKLRVYHI